MLCCVYASMSFTLPIITSSGVDFVMRPSYRLCVLTVHLTVRPSVCPVRATRKRRKNVENVYAPQGTSKWSANFQLKRSKFKVTGRKNLSCLLTGGRLSAGGSGADCKLGILLSAPERETLGNWTDGRMSCRQSAATCVVVQFVLHAEHLIKHLQIMVAVFACTEIGKHKSYLFRATFIISLSRAGELLLTELMSGVNFLSGSEYGFCRDTTGSIVHPSRQCAQCVTMRASRSLMRSSVRAAAYNKDTMYVYAGSGVDDATSDPS